MDSSPYFWYQAHHTPLPHKKKGDSKVKPIKFLMEILERVFEKSGF